MEFCIYDKLDIYDIFLSFKEGSFTLAIGANVSLDLSVLSTKVLYKNSTTEKWQSSSIRTQA